MKAGPVGLSIGFQPVPSSIRQRGRAAGHRRRGPARNHRRRAARQWRGAHPLREVRDRPRHRRVLRDAGTEQPTGETGGIGSARALTVPMTPTNPTPSKALPSRSPRRGASNPFSEVTDHDYRSLTKAITDMGDAAQQMRAELKSELGKLAEQQDALSTRFIELQQKALDRGPYEVGTLSPNPGARVFRRASAGASSATRACAAHRSARRSRVARNCRHDPAYV